MKVLKSKCSTNAPYCHPRGQVSLDKNEFKRGYQTTVCCWHGSQFPLSAYWLLHICKATQMRPSLLCACDGQHALALIVYSPTLFAWSKSYTPNNLSAKYFKLVETFLIVVSQNVFSAEMDNPFFDKVFQLAPGWWWFCKEILPWWVVEFPSLLCKFTAVGRGGGGNKWLVHNNRCC